MKKIILTLALFIHATFANPSGSIQVNLGHAPLYVSLSYDPILAYAFPNDIVVLNYVNGDWGTFGLHENTFKVEKGRNLALRLMPVCGNDSIQSVNINGQVFLEISDKYAPINKSKIYEYGSGFYILLDSVISDLNISVTFYPNPSPKYTCKTSTYTKMAHGNILPFFLTNATGINSNNEMYSVIKPGFSERVKVRADSGYYLKKLYVHYEGHTGDDDTLYNHPNLPGSGPGYEIKYWDYNSGDGTNYGDSIFFNEVFTNATYYAEFAKKPDVPVLHYFYGPYLKNNAINDQVGHNSPTYDCWNDYKSNARNWTIEEKGVHYCYMNTVSRLNFQYRINLTYYDYDYEVLLETAVWKNKKKIYVPNDTLNYPHIFLDTISQANNLFEYYIPSGKYTNIKLKSNENVKLKDSSQLISFASDYFNRNSFMGAGNTYMKTISGIFVLHEGVYRSDFKVTNLDSTVFWQAKRDPSREVIGLKFKGECFDPLQPWNATTDISQNIASEFWENGSVVRRSDSLYVSGVSSPIDAINCGGFELVWNIKAVPVKVISDKAEKLKWNLNKNALTLNSPQEGLFTLTNLKGQVVQTVFVHQVTTQIRIENTGFLIGSLQSKNHVELLFRQQF